MASLVLVRLRTDTDQSVIFFFFFVIARFANSHQIWFLSDNYFCSVCWTGHQKATGKKHVVDP